MSTAATKSMYKPRDFSKTKKKKKAKKHESKEEKKKKKAPIAAATPVHHVKPVEKAVEETWRLECFLCPDAATSAYPHCCYVCKRAFCGTCWSRTNHRATGCPAIIEQDPLTPEVAKLVTKCIPFCGNTDVVACCPPCGTSFCKLCWNVSKHQTKGCPKLTQVSDTAKANAARPIIDDSETTQPSTKKARPEPRRVHFLESLVNSMTEEKKNKSIWKWHDMCAKCNTSVLHLAHACNDCEKAWCFKCSYSLHSAHHTGGLNCPTKKTSSSGVDLVTEEEKKPTKPKPKASTWRDICAECNSMEVLLGATCEDCTKTWCLPCTSSLLLAHNTGGTCCPHTSDGSEEDDSEENEYDHSDPFIAPEGDEEEEEEGEGDDDSKEEKKAAITDDPWAVPVTSNWKVLCEHCGQLGKWTTHCNRCEMAWCHACVIRVLERNAHETEDCPIAAKENQEQKKKYEDIEAAVVEVEKTAAAAASKAADVEKEKIAKYMKTCGETGHLQVPAFMACSVRGCDHPDCIIRVCVICSKRTTSHHVDVAGTWCKTHWAAERVIADNPRFAKIREADEKTRHHNPIGNEDCYKHATGVVAKCVGTGCTNLLCDGCSPPVSCGDGKYPTRMTICASCSRCTRCGNRNMVEMYQCGVEGCWDLVCGPCARVRVVKGAPKGFSHRCEKCWIAIQAAASAPLSSSASSSSSK